MRVVAAAVFALCAGCSFDAAGTAEDLELFDGNTVDTAIAIDSESSDSIFVTEDTAAQPDTSPPPDTAPPPDTTPTCDESMCGTLPGGAKRVALVDRGVACPAGFKSTDIVEETADDGCSCSCSMTSAPTCPGNGAITTRYGNTSTCSSTGLTITSSGSSVCSSIGGSGSLSTYFGATAPAAIGGACAAAPKVDSPAVSRPRRICEPNAGTCAAPICASPFVECIETAGSCPTAFPNARRIGSSAYVTCPTCSCTKSATCSGSITFYGNSGCGGATTTLPVDGSCAAVPMGAGSVTSFKYAPNAATGAMCRASYTSAPGTRTFVGARTLCCK